MKKVVVESGAYTEIARHLGESYPYEGCGFVFGKDGSKRQITVALPVRNVHEEDHRRRFRITPEDYQAAEKFALDKKHDLLGIYHSHPDHPARPSEHDRSQAVPFFSYLILSVTAKGVERMTSWQLNDEYQFDEEEIEVQEVNVNS